MKPIQCAHLLQDFLCSFVQRLPQSPGFPLAPYIIEVMAQASADLKEASIKIQS